MEVFISSIAGYLQGLAASNLKLAAILSILYIVGFVAKLVRSAIEQTIAETPSKADDVKLAAIEASPIAKGVFFVLDLFIRFKKPEAK